MQALAEALFSAQMFAPRMYLLGRHQLVPLTEGVASAPRLIVLHALLVLAPALQHEEREERDYLIAHHSCHCREPKSIADDGI